MNFGKVMLVQFVRKEVYATMVETCFPGVYASDWYQVSVCGNRSWCSVLPPTFMTWERT